MYCALVYSACYQVVPAWYMLVLQVTLVAVSARATSSAKNSKRLSTKAEKGGWRCKSRASTDSVALKIGEAFVARESKSAVHTHVHANTPINRKN